MPLALTVGCALALLLLLVLALRSQRVLETGLPPRTEFADSRAAWDEAGRFARESGGSIVTVLGTGSMAPYIPAAAAGQNPLETTVALAVTVRGANYVSVTPGSLCLYRTTSSAVGVTMHGAALLTSAGWKMSGLHNARSDVYMTSENFVGIVARVFTWSQ